MKRPDQRIVGFSLENDGAIDRARQKLHRKGLDLIVYNPVATMSSATIDSHLIYPDGRTEKLGSRPKSAFADILLERAAALFS
jgi:phosphopantothenoylcysteine synthetase/decarboxylase